MSKPKSVVAFVFLGLFLIFFTFAKTKNALDARRINSENLKTAQTYLDQLSINGTIESKNSSCPRAKTSRFSSRYILDQCTATLTFDPVLNDANLRPVLESKGWNNLHFNISATDEFVSLYEHSKQKNICAEVTTHFAYKNSKLKFTSGSNVVCNRKIISPEIQ